MIDHEDSPEREHARSKRARSKRALGRLLLSALALAFTLGVVFWRARRVFNDLSRPSVANVKVWVDRTGQASFGGRSYDLSNPNEGWTPVDRLLDDIAAAHPGVAVRATVCAPDIHDLSAAKISFRSTGSGITAGVVAQGHALCRP